MLQTYREEMGKKLLMKLKKVFSGMGNEIVTALVHAYGAEYKRRKTENKIALS